MPARQIINLVVYFLALAWIVMASLAWQFGDLQTVPMFKLCAIPVGVVFGCIALNYAIDSTTHARQRGFEVNRNDK